MRTSLLLLLLCARAMASTYYVSVTNGNNITGDGSIGNPWRDITNGISHMVSQDTLNIRAGTYREWIADTIPAGVSFANPTTIQAYNGETVVMNPNAPVAAPDIIRINDVSKHHIVLNGLTLQGSNLVNHGNCLKITYTTPGLPAQFIRVTNCNILNAYDGMGILITSSVDYVPTFCEILNCTVTGAGLSGNQSPNKHGLYISTSSNIVDGCLFRTNLNFDVNLFNGRPSSTIVRNCRFENPARISGKDSIGLFGGSNNWFYNNLFTDKNTGIIINPSDVCTNSLIANNSFLSNGAPIIIENGSQLCGSVKVLNNLFQAGYLGGSGYGFVSLQTGASATSPIFVSNNVAASSGLAGQIVDISKGATVGANLTNQSSAGFIATNNPYDLHLLSTSVAIGAGQTVPEFSIDKDGNARSVPWDAGAFEFIPPPAPAALRVVINGAVLRGFTQNP